MKNQKGFMQVLIIGLVLLILIAGISIAVYKLRFENKVDVAKNYSCKTNSNCVLTDTVNAPCGACDSSSPSYQCVSPQKAKELQEARERVRWKVLCAPCEPQKTIFRCECVWEETLPSNGTCKKTNECTKDEDCGNNSFKCIENKCAREDETANWKTYTNQKTSYSIKYPNDFKLEENAGEPVIYKGEKLVTSPGSPVDPYPPLSLSILNRGKDCGDCNGFQLENVTVAGYRAVKAITPSSTEDIWVYSPNNDKVVRIIYGWKNLTKDEQNTLEKILSTFKFL